MLATISQLVGASRLASIARHMRTACADAATQVVVGLFDDATIEIKAILAFFAQESDSVVDLSAPSQPPSTEKRPSVSRQSPVSDLSSFCGVAPHSESKRPLPKHQAVQVQCMQALEQPLQYATPGATPQFCNSRSQVHPARAASPPPSPTRHAHPPLSTQAHPTGLTLAHARRPAPCAPPNPSPNPA